MLEGLLIQPFSGGVLDAHQIPMTHGTKFI